MLRVSGIVSLIFFSACELIPSLLMQIFSGDDLIISIGSDYLRIAGWSYLITGISQCYLTMMKVANRVKASAFISSCAVILNIVFNLVLIFGMFGIPAMNSRGAALATTLARVIEIVLAVCLTTGKERIRPVWNKIFKVNNQLTKDFMKQCLPLMGGSLLWGVGFTSYTAIIGHIGTDAAAANSVASVVRDLICCICNGIGSAAGIIIGNELGAGKLDKGKAYGIKMKNISFVIGLMSTALVLAATPIV